MALSVDQFRNVAGNRGYLEVSTKNQNTDVKVQGDHKLFGKIATYFKQRASGASDRNIATKNEFLAAVSKRYGPDMADRMKTAVKPDSGAPLSAKTARMLLDNLDKYAGSRTPIPNDSKGLPVHRDDKDRESINNKLVSGKQTLEPSETKELSTIATGQARKGLYLAATGRNEISVSEHLRSAFDALTLAHGGDTAKAREELGKLFDNVMFALPKESIDRTAETLGKAAGSRADTDPMKDILSDFKSKLEDRSSTVRPGTKQDVEGFKDFLSFSVKTDGTKTKPTNVFENASTVSNTLISFCDSLKSNLSNCLKEVDGNGRFILDVLDEIHPREKQDPPLTKMADLPLVGQIRNQIGSNGPSYLELAAAVELVDLMAKHNLLDADMATLKPPMTKEMLDDLVLQIGMPLDDIGRQAFGEDGKLKAGTESIVSDLVGQFAAGLISTRGDREAMFTLMGQTPPQFEHGDRGLLEGPSLKVGIQNATIFMATHKSGINSAMSDPQVQTALGQALNRLPINQGLSSRLADDAGDSQAVGLYVENSVLRKLTMHFGGISDAANQGDDRKLLNLFDELQGVALNMDRDLGALARAFADRQFLDSIPPEHRSTIEQMGEQFANLRDVLSDPNGGFQQMVRTTGMVLNDDQMRAALLQDIMASLT